MKLNGGLYFLGIIILIYFAWTQVRPSIVRSNCFKDTYQPRVNEDNLEWAEGKIWASTLVDGMAGGYAWIYTDQSSFNYGIEAKKQRDKTLKERFEKCLLKSGLK